jgi:hypothetical protein
MAPCFSGSSLHKFEPTLKTYKKRFMDVLKKAAEENHGIVDMSDWFNRFSFDVTSVLLIYLTRKRLPARLLLGRTSGHYKEEPCTRMWRHFTGVFSFFGW